MKESPSKKEQSREILATWVHQYSDELFSWAYYKTSEQRQAEDLVQDTFMAASESFKKFQQKSSPKTWLFAILNRKIIDSYRKKHRIEMVNSRSLSAQGDHDILDKLFDRHGNWKKEHKPKDWQIDEAHILDNVEFRQTLQKCMHKLPASWLSSIQLKYLEGKEGKDICQVLQISSSNYWQILHRAKLQLRHCLEHNWFNS